MHKGLKIGLYSAIGLVGLIVVGLIVLVSVVNPNDYKPQISAAVEKATGRKLEIAGKIGWSFFPSIGISVDQVTLSNPPGFGDKPFARIGQADLQLKLLPLLTKRVEFSKIYLKDTTINLLTNAQGKNNWTTLKTQETRAEKKQADNKKATPKEIKKAAKRHLDFDINSIDIQNANLNWQDDVSGQRFQLHQLNFSGDDLGPNRTFPITLQFKLHSSGADISGDVDLSGKILFEPSAERYQIDKLNLSGTITQHRFKKSKKFPFSLSTSIKTNLKAQTLNAKDVIFKLGNMTVKTQVTGENIIDTPVFKGKLTTDEFDLKKILTGLGMPVNTASKKALQHVRLSATWSASPKFIKLTDLHAKIDATDLNGNFSINHFDRPAIDFDLKMTQLNLDHYRLTGKSTPKKKTAAQAHRQPAKKSSKPSTDTALQHLSANGMLTIGTLISHNLTMTQIKLTVRGNNGLIKIAPFSANLYGGNTTGNSTINLREEAPQYRISENINRVQLRPLLHDLADFDKFSGIANMFIDVSMGGNGAKQMIRNMNGRFKLNISKGVFKGADVNFQFNRILALAQKRTLPTRNTGQTAFRTISGSGTIKRGVIYNPDLLLSAPPISITGNGTANLNNQRLNYNVSLNKAGTQIAIPVLVTGTFSQPSFQPNMAALAEILLKGVIQKNIKHLMPGEIIKDVGKEPAKSLEGIKKLVPGF